MRKTIFSVIVLVFVMFVLITNVNALDLNNYVSIGAKTPTVTSTSELSGLTDNYDEDSYQTCEGSDSVLGDPNDDTSVAWLLDQILTYATLAGMLLVVVLSSIDFVTVIVKSDDEAMAKAAKKFGLRLIFAALLFFVPTLTNAILDIFGLTSQSTCGLQQ